MNHRCWVVVAYDHDGDGEASKKFWSSNAAQDYAIEQLEEHPDKYSEMIVMESSWTVMNMNATKQPTFVHTGPEYVHKDRVSNDGDRLRLEHSKR